MTTHWESTKKANRANAAAMRTLAKLYPEEYAHLKDVERVRQGLSPVSSNPEHTLTTDCWCNPTVEKVEA